MNKVNLTLAALTLAATAMPASAQFGGNYGRPFGGNVGINQGGFQNFGNPFANLSYGQVSPSFFYNGQGFYGQGNPNVIFQGGGNFPYFGWNQNTVINPDGSLDLPPYSETYGANGNFTQTEPDPAALARNRANALPRESDAIQVSKDRNKISFAWQGDSNSVRRITFSLLDKAKQPVRQTIITKLPAETSLTRNNRMAYYRVVVEYINGTTNSVVAPL